MAPPSAELGTRAELDARAQPPRLRVGLLILGLPDLSGGGGTERYFANIFAAYDRATLGAFELSLISDNQSLRQLTAAGQELVGERIVCFDGRVTSLHNIRAFCRMCHEADIRLLHIPLATPGYLPLLFFLQLGLGSWRPSITLTMPDCSLSHTWRNPFRCRSIGEAKVWALYRAYFHTIKFDGVLSWYEHFVKSVGSDSLRGRPLVVPAAYCFVDNERFRPADEKRKLIVFAGRLTRVKQPLMFLQGLEQAVERAPELFEGWEVAIYGRGALQARVAHDLAASSIQDRVTLQSTASMAEIFAQSRLFVSTQDYDNFTSLSMLEAMASGNSVIARNVGQTRSFVRDRGNGLLISDDMPASLADALIEYLSHPERHATMEVESRRIAVEQHNAANALQDLDHFWQQILDRTQS